MLRELIESKGVEVILASRSPRRVELLGGAGIPFVLADKYDVEEVYPPSLSPREVSEYLSNLKSSAFPRQLTDKEVIITADTVVLLDDDVLGKPVNRDNAIAMLQRLSAKAHDVITGVTIRDIDRRVSFSTTSTVYFRALTLDEITYYVDTFKPMDKAGSYGIQEWIGYVGIERIEGSFYNVMGLPTQRLHVELTKFIKSKD